MANGKILGPSTIVSASSAKGIWKTSDVYIYRKQSLWPSTIVRSGLIAWLDSNNSASYPGSGNVWYDLSGNSNNFTLYGSPSISNGVMTFNGSSQYAISTNNIDFTSLNSVTIEVYYKSSPNTNVGMVYEHTTDWNSVSGGFGLYQNSRGGANVPDYHHTNQNLGNGSFSVRNYGFVNGAQLNQHVNVHSRVSDPSGRLVYVNGQLQPFSSADSSGGNTVPTGTDSSAGSFSNAKLHLMNRNGGLLVNGSVARVLVYNRKLTSSEILQNYNSHLATYGA